MVDISKHTNTYIYREQEDYQVRRYHEVAVTGAQAAGRKGGGLVSLVPSLKNQLAHAVACAISNCHASL